MTTPILIKQPKTYKGFYDPEIARFLQEDTFRGWPRHALSLNKYTYVHNNPLKYYDPTGHSATSLANREARARALAGGRSGGHWAARDRAAAAALAAATSNIDGVIFGPGITVGNLTINSGTVINHGTIGTITRPPERRSGGQDYATIYNSGIIGTIGISSGIVNNSGFIAGSVSVGSGSVVNTGLIGGNVNVGSGSVSNSDGIIGGNVNVHSGTVNSGLIIGSVNIGGKSTFEFVDYQRFAATTAGNLIVNGRNIAFTQVFNDRMYGSVLNFFEAIGANIDINNARLRVDFNGIHISFGISNSSRDTHGNAIVWQEYNRGRFKIEDLHYRTIGRGAEFIISDLQSLINLAGDRVTTLAYDLGSRGGTHIRSSFRTVAILPTDDAIIKWAEMNSNLTLPPSLNLRQDLNLGFADLMMYVDANYADIFHTVFAAQEFATLSRAVAERHPFVTINDYRSWFTLGFGQTNVTGSLPSNIYTLTDRNIGVFRYGVHGIGLPGIHR